MSKLFQGIDFKVISKWLGHSKLEITEKIYIDILSDYEKQQSNKVNLTLI